MKIVGEKQKILPRHEQRDRRAVFFRSRELPSQSYGKSKQRDISETIDLFSLLKEQ